MGSIDLGKKINGYKYFLLIFFLGIFLFFSAKCTAYPIYDSNGGAINLTEYVDYYELNNSFYTFQVNKSTGKIEHFRQKGSSNDIIINDTVRVFNGTNVYSTFTLSNIEIRHSSPIYKMLIINGTIGNATTTIGILKKVVIATESPTVYREDYFEAIGQDFWLDEYQSFLNFNGGSKCQNNSGTNITLVGDDSIKYNYWLDTNGFEDYKTDWLREIYTGNGSIYVGSFNSTQFGCPVSIYEARWWILDDSHQIGAPNYNFTYFRHFEPNKIMVWDNATTPKIVFNVKYNGANPYSTINTTRLRATVNTSSSDKDFFHYGFFLSINATGYSKETYDSGSQDVYRQVSGLFHRQFLLKGGTPNEGVYGEASEFEWHTTQSISSMDASFWGSRDDAIANTYRYLYHLKYEDTNGTANWFMYNNYDAMKPTQKCGYPNSLSSLGNGIIANIRSNYMKNWTSERQKLYNDLSLLKNGYIAGNWTANEWTQFENWWGNPNAYFARAPSNDYINGEFGINRGILNMHMMTVSFALEMRELASYLGDDTNYTVWNDLYNKTLEGYLYMVTNYGESNAASWDESTAPFALVRKDGQLSYSRTVGAHDFYEDNTWYMLSKAMRFKSSAMERFLNYEAWWLEKGRGSIDDPNRNDEISTWHQVVGALAAIDTRVTQYCGNDTSVSTVVSSDNVDLLFTKAEGSSYSYIRTNQTLINNNSKYGGIYFRDNHFVLNSSTVYFLDTPRLKNVSSNVMVYDAWFRTTDNKTKIIFDCVQPPTYSWSGTNTKDGDPVGTWKSGAQYNRTTNHWWTNNTSLIPTSFSFWINTPSGISYPPATIEFWNLKANTNYTIKNDGVYLGYFTTNNSGFYSFEQRVGNHAVEISEIGNLSEIVTKFTFSLNEGWNLISLPLINNSLDVDSLGKVIGGDNVKYILRRNATTNSYDSYIFGFSLLNENFDIKPDYGYFIYTNHQTNFSLSGFIPVNRSINLIKGWNLIGWTSLSTSSATKAFVEPLGDKVVYVTKRNNATGEYQTYVVGFSDIQDDFAVEPGHGYFVYVTSNCTLVI